MAHVSAPPQTRFCWFCYWESAQRVAAGLDPALRASFLAAARRNQRRGIPYPTPAEHARHAGAREAADYEDLEMEEG